VKKLDTQKMRDLHRQALEEFDASMLATQDEREQSLEDRRFYSIAGAQWEGVFGEQFQNRPMLEINKTLLSVIRIFNDYRNNRISATFVSKRGDESEETAEVCAGLYRADQQDSVAEEAYDNAFEEGVGGGMGAWRLRAYYEDEYDDDNDWQRIGFEPITDADTCVFFDPNAKRQDKSDAQYCFVLTGMSKAAYENEFGEAYGGFDKTITDIEFDWCTADLIYVAEYYRIEETTEQVHRYRTVSGNFETYPESKLTEELIAELGEVGTVRVSTKPVKRRRVRKLLLSGERVLRDEGYIAGREIPIVPFYGKRWFVDGRERFMGHVRPAKDPARLKNMQISTLAEKAAEGGERVPIFTPEQLAGHTEPWARRAIDRPGALFVNPVTQADGTQAPMGPLGYTESADLPQAMAALIELVDGDMRDILGNQEGGEKIVSNISGDAVEMIQSRLDMQTFIYVDNFKKAERRSAQIWLGMAADLYDDESRIMKIIGEDGETDYANLGDKVFDESGVPRRMVDLSRAKFDVQVTVGPTSATRRQATVRSLTEMLGVIADPVDQKVISAAILRNMDGEGIGSVRDHFRKQLVAMGVEEPTEEEAEEMAQAQQGQQQPGAQELYLVSEAKKNEADAAKADADTLKKRAETDETRAKTLETLAGIDRAEREQAQQSADIIRLALGSGTAAP
jgi:hypothetical protein